MIISVPLISVVLFIWAIPQVYCTNEEYGDGNLLAGELLAPREIRENDDAMLQQLMGQLHPYFKRSYEPTLLEQLRPHFKRSDENLLIRELSPRFKRNYVNGYDLMEELQPHFKRNYDLPPSSYAVERQRSNLKRNVGHSRSFSGQPLFDELRPRFKKSTFYEKVSDY
uniref:Short neuropeptide F n=1 Tax=Syphacia muris TaxID=451379 RepID=A0A0N5ARN4_9BILA